MGIGDVIDRRFRLVDEIGEGGMGRIFEAVDERYDRPAAIKLIARRLAADPEFRVRFGREAEAAERADHPHILPVWTHGPAGGYLYLATPLCDADLAAHVEERGKLDLDETLRLLGQVASALDWAHGRGLVHQDVKPENVLLVGRGAEHHAYLGDFGMARVAGAATFTQVGHATGLSPAYAAPEQWKGGAVSAATDQYALAATLHTCLTGRPPFATRSLADLREAHLHEPPPELAGRPAVSRALATALDKDPARRFGSCRELIGVIRAAVPAPETTRPTAVRLIDACDRHDEDPDSLFKGSTLTITPPSWTTRDAPGPDTASPPGRADDAPAAGPRRRERRRRAALLFAPAVFAAATVVALLATGVIGGGASPPTRLADDLTIGVGALPVDVVAGGGSVWVANQGDHTITGLDPRTARPRGPAVKTVSQVSQLAVGDGRLWAASPDGRVQGFDARTGRPLGAERAFDLNVDDLAVSPGALWIADSVGNVYKLPIAGDTLGPAGKPVYTTAGTGAVTFGGGLVWAASAQTGFIHGIEPATAKIVRVGTATPGVQDLTVVHGQVWAANPKAHRLVHINAATGAVGEQRMVPGDGPDAALSADGPRLMYVSLPDGRATMLDISTGGLTMLRRLPAGASSAVLAAGRLWVSYDSDDVVRSVRVPGLA